MNLTSHYSLGGKKLNLVLITGLTVHGFAFKLEGLRYKQAVEVKNIMAPPTVHIREVLL